MGELKGDYSRLRDQALRKHSFSWSRCGKMKLEGDLAQLSKWSKCPEFC